MKALKNYKFTLAISLVFLFTGCATTYEGAENSYLKGDYVKAEQQWSKLAEAGDTNSMHRLYTSKVQPTATEITWLKKAADLNHVKAQHDYGMLLYEQENYAEAKKYLELAAENSYKESQIFLDKNKEVFPYLIAIEADDKNKIKELADFYRNKEMYKEANFWYKKCVDINSYCSFYLGLAYDLGYGVTINYKKAYDWYLMSAQQGNSASARNLAWLYEEGQGVEVNYKEAFKWMKFSFDTFQAETPEVSLGRYYLYGIGTEKDYAKALKIFNKYSTTNSTAAYQLARMYYFGWGVKQGYQKSYQLFSSKLLEKSPSSIYYLAEHHYRGYGKDKSYLKALQLYTQAAELKDTDAQFRLGWMYDNGEGTQKDIRKAFYWYTQAAENGNSAAQNNLGVMYVKGEATEQSYSKAINWYEKSAKNGDIIGQRNLAYFYKSGTGIAKNLPKAVYWYAKSAQQNDEESKQELPKLLDSLTKYYVNNSNVALHASSINTSQVIKRLAQGSTVYTISRGYNWTEVYYPEEHSLGFIENEYLSN